MKSEDRPTASQGKRAAQDKDGLFLCPHCGCCDFRVVQTWYLISGVKKRAYRCRHCGKHEFNAEVTETIKVV